LVRIPTKEKILSVFICDPTIPKIYGAKNPTLRKHCLMFLQPFNIQLIPPKNQKLLLDKFFY
jgi:hypothetical protein